MKVELTFTYLIIIFVFFLMNTNKTDIILIALYTLVKFKIIYAYYFILRFLLRFLQSDSPFSLFIRSYFISDDG